MDDVKDARAACWTVTLRTRSSSAHVRLALIPSSGNDVVTGPALVTVARLGYARMHVSEDPAAQTQASSFTLCNIVFRFDVISRVLKAIPPASVSTELHGALTAWFLSGDSFKLVFPRSPTSNYDMYKCCHYCWRGGGINSLGLIMRIIDHPTEAFFGMGG